MHLYYWLHSYWHPNVYTQTEGKGYNKLKEIKQVSELTVLPHIMAMQDVQKAQVISSFTQSDVTGTPCRSNSGWV